MIFKYGLAVFYNMEWGEEWAGPGICEVRTVILGCRRGVRKGVAGPGIQARVYI